MTKITSRESQITVCEHLAKTIIDTRAEWNELHDGSYDLHIDSVKMESQRLGAKLVNAKLKLHTELEVLNQQYGFDVDSPLMIRMESSILKEKLFEFSKLVHDYPKPVEGEYHNPDII